MSGLIGGSGSTGSSLLRQILNRHSQLFCGPETSLFCKPALYNSWISRKKHLFARGINGLKNHSYHIYRGTDLIKEEIGLTQDQIQQHIDRSDQFSDFVHSFYQEILKDKSKSFWLEKTPSNAFSFNNFSQHFDGYLIHIYRNPYETICSLHKRGFSILTAAGIYLMNSSHALSMQDHPKYYQLSYEQLIDDPKTEITKLCGFLNFDFEDRMLSEVQSKTYSDDPTKLANWKYDETAPISKKRNSNFDQLPLQKQLRIHQAICSIKIKDHELTAYNLTHSNIQSLANKLGYQIKKMPEPDQRTLLKSELNSDLIRHTKKLSHYHMLNYPLELI